MRDDENTQLCQTSREGRPWPRKRPGSTLRPPRPWPCRPEGRRAGAKGPQGLSVPCCDPPVTGEAAGQAGPGPGRCPVLLSSEAAHGAVLPAGRPKGPGCWLRAGCVSLGACGTRAGPRQRTAALAGHVRQASAPLPGAKVTAQVTLSRSVVVGGRGCAREAGGTCTPGGGGHRAPRTAADLGGPGKRVLPHARTQLPARGQLHQRRRKSTRKEQVSLNRFPFEGPLLAGDPVWVGGLAPREAAGQDLRAGMQGTGTRSAETPAQERAGRHQESWAHPGPRKGCAPNPGGAGGRGPCALRI